MKRLIWSLGLCALLSACNLLRGGFPPVGGGGQCSPPSTLPPLQSFTPEKPLPAQGSSYLVASLCLSTPMRVVMHGVEAKSCSITFRVSAHEPDQVQALLSQAQRTGLPLTLFTSPVSSARGSAGGSTVSVSPCDLIKGAQQGSDVPTGGGGPVAGKPPQDTPQEGTTPSEGVDTATPEEELLAQRAFAQIALEAARALQSSVTSSVKTAAREY